MVIGSRTPLPNFKKGSAGNWLSGSFIECNAINDENSEVRSYQFKDPYGGGFKYKAGQHISILLPLDDGEEYRTFTIASSPTRAHNITLTVKTNRPNGATAWMRENIIVGTKLIAVGPTGPFNIADHPCHKLLLICAGSGITPMMSILRWLWDRKEDIEITFIHYAKNPDQFLFNDELKQIAKDYSSLTVHQISTDRPDGKTNNLPNFEQITSLIDMTDHDVFCCGPNGFMQKIEKIVKKAGANHYYQESFGTQIKSNINSNIVTNAENLTINYKGRIIEAKKGENLLAVLKKHKFIIPTGCQSGMCGTCHLKILRGSVDMNHQGGLSKAQEDEGIILACSSTITTDLTLI